MTPEEVLKPVVSVVIATFNRPHLLPETLNSILGQQYKNWECILVDDGSTDKTIKVLQKYAAKDARFRLYHRPENYKKGPAGTFNYGLDLAKGEFIQWFGSDDLMHPQMLSEKVRIFNENPDVQSVFSNLYFFENGNSVNGQTKLRKPLAHFYENAVTWNIPVWSLSFTFRTQFLKDAGIRFDESLKRLIDYDFHIRLFVQHPHDVYFLEKPLSYARRNNKDSITTSYFCKERIVDLERSEYIVADKIIRLLIDENKFTHSMEKFFFCSHKRSISRLMSTPDRELVESIKKLVEFYLRHKKRYIKLAKFRLGFFLSKIFPVPNLFLIYQLSDPFRFIYVNMKRAYRIVFVRGYLSEKFKLMKTKKSLSA